MHFLTRKCCVPECGNASTMGDGCFKTYFEFPSDKVLRGKWFNAICVTQEADMKDVKICDDHFDNDTKFTTQNSIKRLRLGSIPSLKLPKYVCKTCFGTVDKKAKDPKKFCKCEKPDVEKMPKTDEDIKKEKDEKLKKIKREKERKERKERLEKERIEKEKSKTDKDKKIKEAKLNENIKNEKREDKESKGKRDETSEKNKKEKTDRSKRDGSKERVRESERKASSSKEKTRSRRDSESSSGGRKEWTPDEKDTLVQLVEKHGKLRKLETGRFRIQWEPVLSRFRQMGYKSHDQKDVLRQWGRILERSRKIHKERCVPNKLEKRVIKFAVVKDIPYLYESGSGSDSDDDEESTESKSVKKRREESTGSDSDESERQAINNKAKYGTYTIVNKDRTKAVKRRRSRAKNIRENYSSDESYFSEPMKISKKDRMKNTKTESSDDSEVEEKERIKRNRNKRIKSDNDDNGGSDRGNDSDVDSKKSKVKSEDSSSSDEYMNQEEVSKFFQKEDSKSDLEKVKVKGEAPEQPFGIWEVKNSGMKPEPTSDIDQTSSGNEGNNDSDVNNDSSDDSDDDDNQKLGLEDLKKMGVNVDDILKAEKLSDDSIDVISEMDSS